MACIDFFTFVATILALKSLKNNHFFYKDNLLVQTQYRKVGTGSTEIFAR